MGDRPHAGVAVAAAISPVHSYQRNAVLAGIDNRPQCQCIRHPNGHTVWPAQCKRGCDILHGDPRPALLLRLCLRARDGHAGDHLRWAVEDGKRERESDGCAAAQLWQSGRLARVSPHKQIGGASLPAVVDAHGVGDRAAFRRAGLVYGLHQREAWRCQLCANVAFPHLAGEPPPRRTCDFCAQGCARACPPAIEGIGAESLHRQG